MRSLFMLFNALLVLAISVVGCDSDGTSSLRTAGPCDTMSDCEGGTVCVVTAGVGLCSFDCSVSSDECGASASCKGIGALEINVCQEAEEEKAPEEVKEDDTPYIPCTTDAECQALDSGAICAEFQGRKDCTIPCSTQGEKSGCNMPPMMGVSLDFMICNPDEAQPERLACLPDAACFSNMMSCMDLGMFGGGDGGGFGFDDEDFGF